MRSVASSKKNIQEWLIEATLQRSNTELVLFLPQKCCNLNFTTRDRLAKNVKSQYVQVIPRSTSSSMFIGLLGSIPEPGTSDPEKNGPHGALGFSSRSNKTNLKKLHIFS